MKPRSIDEGGIALITIMLRDYAVRADPKAAPFAVNKSKDTEPPVLDPAEFNLTYPGQ